MKDIIVMKVVCVPAGTVVENITVR